MPLRLGNGITVRGSTRLEVRAEYTERESERNTHKDGNMLTQIGPHTPQEKKKKIRIWQ